MNEQGMRSMQNHNAEVEIDLVNLTYHIARRWRCVLAAGVIAGAVLGGYKGVTGIQNLRNKAYLEAQNAEYLKQKASYDSSVESLRRQIQNITDEINTNQEYQESSVLMNIDPYDAYRETATFYISSDYQIMPGMTYQNPDKTKSIISAYLAIAQNGQLYKDVTSELNDEMTIRNLKELINVSADYDNNLLSIVVYGKDKEMASKLMELIRDHLSNQEDQIANGVGEHTIKLIEKSSTNTVDEDLKKKHTDFNNNLTSLQNSLTDRQKKLADLAAPKGTLITKESVVKNVLKFGIIGGILGVFCAAGCICVGYVAKGRIHTEYEMERYGVRVLGSYYEPVRKRMFSFIDSLTENLSGASAKSRDLSRVCEAAAVRLEGMMKAENCEGAKICLVGGIDEKDLNRVKEAMTADGRNVSLEVAGNLADDSEAIRKAQAADGVLLVEQKNASKKSAVETELAMLEDFGKRVWGAVLI
ncbi:hypothetical protein [[Clostridium] aminophilum]|uniref:Capsular polysaccharide biosynthesis protein n=1 Tax=[Clostridium] aminophilum TaxID=1526 RepID=A0A1I6K5X0_9FIRM|nr:hypothetical protein [[Clostridium] aminophilum]SFR86653.1 hypothetical protein SAMN02910262_02285 [[Clostridium] aminophilum]